MDGCQCLLQRVVAGVNRYFHALLLGRKGGDVTWQCSTRGDVAASTLAPLDGSNPRLGPTRAGVKPARQQGRRRSGAIGRVGHPLAGKLGQPLHGPSTDGSSTPSRLWGGFLSETASGLRRSVLRLGLGAQLNRRAVRSWRSWEVRRPNDHLRPPRYVQQMGPPYAGVSGCWIYSSSRSHGVVMSSHASGSSTCRWCPPPASTLTSQDG